ncbi:hypothetical protein E4U11_001966 [Claviceps purpurea]|nr:hypothetical protein E4U11_001966 [Claviceps purpurea]
MLMSVKIESIPPTLAVGLEVAKPAGRGVKVFLRIGEDPSRVEYHLALPIRDVESVEVEGDADCQLVYERVLVYEAEVAVINPLFSSTWGNRTCIRLKTKLLEG